MNALFIYESKQVAKQRKTFILDRQPRGPPGENLYVFASAPEGACVDFELVLQRSNALLLAAEDTGLIQIMPDCLRARLKFLERSVVGSP
jgi:hypothetical protein